MRETVRKKKTKKISLKVVKKRKEEYHSSSDSESVGKDSEAERVEQLSESSDAEIEHSDDQDGVMEEPPKNAQGSEVDALQQKTKKLSSVISKIISSNQPILAKKRKLEDDINEAKLEEKAKKFITSQRKLKKDVGRIKPSSETLTFEKQLKKVATKGVVQLFNALRKVQKEVKELQQDGVQKHANEVPVLSKNTFIKALKDGNVSNQAVESQVSFLKDDFATKASKHWDEDD
jgi:hypothetical protein